MKMQLDSETAFRMASVTYLGTACPVCRKTFATFDDLKPARFGSGVVVHQACWPQYTEQEAQRLRGIIRRAFTQVEFGLGRVVEVLKEAGVHDDQP